MNMRLADSLKTNFSHDYQIGDSKGSNLLGQLEDRVNQTLAQKNNVAEKVNPQQVLDYLAQISNQPFPGMNHNILI